MNQLSDTGRGEADGLGAAIAGGTEVHEIRDLLSPESEWGRACYRLASSPHLFESSDGQAVPM